jgi:uncharacterized protein YqeY
MALGTALRDLLPWPVTQQLFLLFVCGQITLESPESCFVSKSKFGFSFPYHVKGVFAALHIFHVKGRPLLVAGTSVDTPRRLRLSWVGGMGQRQSMSDILSQIQEDLKTAMRAKDTLALNALRALKSALTNAAIEKGGLGTPLDHGECVSVVRKQVKQRHDSLGQFAANNRPELAAIEQAEISVLERYLPAALTAEELDMLITAAIAETGAATKADLGKVIKLAQEKAAGRADGKTLSQAVMRRLV